MQVQPTHDQCSIVLLGSFNPRIFHPAWLARNELISKDAEQEANILIVHADVASFVVSHMQFEVQPERFQVRCETRYKEIIKDVITSIFGSILPHSLVWQMGINRAIAFSCKSEEKRDQLGQLLAPITPWGEWGKQLALRAEQPGSEPHGGLMRMMMRQQPRPDGHKGYIQADLRPAEFDRESVIVEINNHFNLGPPQEVIGSLPAVDILTAKWEEAMQTAEYIVDCLGASLEKIA